MTFQEEMVGNCLEELKVLHWMHWQETEGYRHGLKFNPDYERLIAFNSTGYFRLYTIRDGIAMIGDIGMYISQSMHTQTRIATEDTLFIHPDYRKGFIASRFVRYVEDCLVADDVREINITVKRTNRANVLMQRLGYAHVADHYTKFVGEDHVLSRSSRTA